MALKHRLPFPRWSVWRLVAGVRNINRTGQVGDGREAAAVDFVLSQARAGDPDAAGVGGAQARGCAPAHTSRSAVTVTRV